MANKKIALDIGCGHNKHKGFIGLDNRLLEGVDIVADLESFPYPIKDESCQIINASHVIEHIKPWLSVKFLNELWRIASPNGKLVIETPVAGTDKYWKDPTHCNGCTEETFTYFDPKYEMYRYYTPKPWNIHHKFPMREGNYLFVLMEKICG